ncbi:MAG: hypothetical protein M9924_10120 [Rhizobiaceae bacterium]|nr:hypothetical protein [Rhizobiaceae bacterium]
MTQIANIDAPTSGISGPRYDRECREALRPAFENLLDLAAEAGWDRRRAAFELMYLASSNIADGPDAARRAD